MAYSRVVVEGDGTTNQFAVNFALNYLLEADVTCRVGTEVDGGGDPVYRTITFLSTNLIQVGGSVPGLGVPIVFERTVPKENLRVNFSNGDQLDEDNLDTAQKQALMAVHEVLDGRFAAFTDDIDAGGFSVVNVRDPVAADEAATKGYVDAHNSSTEATAAIAAAAAAQEANDAAQAASAGLSDALAGAQAAQEAAEDARDEAQATVTGKADIDSPHLTGVPTAPTADPSSDSDQIATTAFVKANVPAAATVTLRNYFAGLRLSNDAVSPNTKLNIDAGQATNDDNTVNMVLATAFAKTTGAWAAGTGNGALDSGSIAAGAWYHVFLISTGIEDEEDVLFSASATAPTLPTGYLYKRRLGSFKTNLSSQIIKFVQFGNDFVWDVQGAADAGLSNPGTSAVMVTCNVPHGVTVRVRVGFFFQETATTRRALLITSPNIADSVPDAGMPATAITGPNGVAGALIGTIDVWTDTSRQIRCRVDGSAATTALFIRTIGWYDPL